MRYARYGPVLSPPNDKRHQSNAAYPSFCSHCFAAIIMRLTMIQFVLTVVSIIGKLTVNSCSLW